MTKRSNTGTWIAIVGVLAGLSLIGAIAGDGDSQAGGSVQRDQCDRTTAFVMSQTFVKRQLRAPGTARFPFITEAKVIELGDCTFEVQSHVDAANAFGGEVRTPYVAVVSSEDGGRTWTAEDVWL